MQTFLAVTPGEEQAAARFRRPLAHVAYRIGTESVLLRRNLLLQTRGGLLSVSDRDAPPIDDPGALCAAVLRECRQRRHGDDDCSALCLCLPPQNRGKRQARVV